MRRFGSLAPLLSPSSAFYPLLFALAGCGQGAADDRITVIGPVGNVAPALEPSDDESQGDEDSRRISPPLSDLPPAPPPRGPRLHIEGDLPTTRAAGPDPVIQSSAPTRAAPSLANDFEGVGRGFSGPSGTFVVNSAPPDTDGAVGPNHYVQIVNTDIAVFNKSGQVIFGPVATNTLWSGFGGGCQANNDGDGIVQYDKIADRWIITQFSVSTTPYLQCVAVSTTGDPTGSYARYSFQYTNFPDYPKLTVWPDAYYVTFNQFAGGVRFAGALVCAYDRGRMLQGLSATQQCFSTSSAFGGLLPSDLDGPTPPPAGSPSFVVAFDTNGTSLDLWKFHVDWATPSNSTFSGPSSIPVAAFAPACNGGACIPQAGTNQQLDSLADRLMYRLAYRNFGDHEALVVNHSVTAGSSVGVRWYELRNPNGTPTVFQQGTYAPDTDYRWMGSVAMDHSGNIALGFSISGPSRNPGINYTARLSTDPPGVMTQGEGVVQTGSGSQTGGLNRWGDYSAMAIDPADDCTFWYTNQYLSTSGSFNWQTRVGSFRLTGCGAPPPPDFSLSLSPTSRTVRVNTNASYTVGIGRTSGFAGAVQLTISGLPSGSTATFSPNPSSSASSALTIHPTRRGTFSFTVTGTSGSLVHTTRGTIQVTR